jgi:peptidoglycan/xylan/chitin deacetylase (PgdA/CDA1 family)
VLAFHDVKEKEWFEEVIKMLVSNYCVITPLQFHIKKFDTEKINILLTFDDGYASWVDVCAPILKRNNIKALFFINSGLLTIANDPTAVTAYMRDRLLLTPKAPLTWEGAQTLVAQGHTIGGHSINHYNLAVLDQSVLESEIKDDKKTIEETLKVTLTDFAYPFGRKNNYNTNVFGVAKHAGYTWQYAAQSSFSKGGTITPRTLLEKNQPVASIKQWIEGGYDIFDFFR